MYSSGRGRSLSNPPETGLVRPERIQDCCSKGDHVGIIRPSDLEGHGVLGGVVLRELLGEYIFLTLSSCRRDRHS